MSDGQTQREKLDDIHEAVMGLKVDMGVMKLDVGVLKDDVGVLKDDVGVLKDDMNEVKPTVIEWRQVFEGNPRLKVKGVFERIFDASARTDLEIHDLASVVKCQGDEQNGIKSRLSKINGFHNGLDSANKSKIKEKAKKAALPVGIVSLIGMAITIIYELVTRTN